MRRSALLIAVVVFLCIIALATGQALGKTKLTFWAISDPPKDAYIARLIKDYEAANPGVEIVYQAFPARDYDNKLMVALVGKTGPDLFDSREATTATLALKGLAVPADYAALGYRSAQALEDDYISLGAFSYDDVVYGLPFSINVYSLFLNGQHFRDAGLDPEGGAPATWDELVAAARKTTRTDGNRITVEGYGLPYGMNTGWYMAEFSAPLYQRGGSFLSNNDTGKEVTIASEAARATVGLWNDLVNKYKVSNLQRTEFSYDSFLHETTSMITVGGFVLQRAADENPALSRNIRVVVVPQVPAGKRTVMVTGWGWFVNSTSKSQAEAWKFIRFAAEKPGEWLKEAGFLVPKANLLSTPEGRTYPFMKVFMDGMKYGRPRLPHENYNEISNIMKRAIDRVLTGQMSVADSLAQAKSEIESAISK